MLVSLLVTAPQPHPTRHKLCPPGQDLSELASKNTWKESCSGQLHRWGHSTAKPGKPQRDYAMLAPQWPADTQELSSSSLMQMYRAKSREDKLLVALEEAETSAVTWSLSPSNPYIRARSICLCWEPGSRAANTWKPTLNTFDCKKWIFFFFLALQTLTMR